MNAVELIQRLHRHRAWVNGNLLTAAAGLRGDQLRSPFQIGQGSVWNSLVHLHAAEYVWLETLLGDEARLLPGDVAGKLPGNQEGEGGITDLDDLRQKWASLEDRRVRYLASLTPESLDDLVYKRISVTGQRFGSRRGDDAVSFPDSEELVRNSGMPVSALIEVGDDHRLTDPEPLRKMLEPCEGPKERNDLCNKLHE